MNDIKINLGDCFEELSKIESGSIDLVLIDPPYGTIKNLGKNTMSHNKSLDWDIKINTEKMFSEINRVLKFYGRAVIFCQEPYTSELMSYQKTLKFNMRGVWIKNNTGNALNSKKTLVNKFEDILFYTKNSGYENNQYLREYSKIFFQGIKESDIEKIVNYKAKSFYGYKGCRFRLCTEDVYNKITDSFNLKDKEFFIEYKELLKNNHKPKATFNLKGKQKSNVFEYQKKGKNFHPTQKPTALLEDIIETFSNEGDIILDFTMGSGSTGVAAKNKKRKFIGIELNEEYYNIAYSRLFEDK